MNPRWDGGGGRDRRGGRIGFVFSQCLPPQTHDSVNSFNLSIPKEVIFGHQFTERREGA